MPLEQKILRIGLPSDTVLRGSDFREALAKNFGDAPAFFHRTPDGKTIPGIPGIRTVSGASWVGVLAMPGTDNHELLTNHVGQILNVASKLTNRSLPVEFETRTFSATHSVVPITYFVRECAIKRRHKRRKAMNDQELMTEVINSGLERISVAYGIDLPSSESMDIRITEITKSRGVALRTTEGVTREFTHVVDCEFTAFVDLSGMWQVGNLTSRGYGRIGRVRNQLSSFRQKDMGVLR